jgi:hypothetical protein
VRSGRFTIQSETLRRRATLCVGLLPPSAIGRVSYALAGGLRMNVYRVFCLDHASKIEAAHEVEASSDAEALSKATRIGEGVTREVWLRDRLVGRVGQPPA